MAKIQEPITEPVVDPTKKIMTINVRRPMGVKEDAIFVGHNGKNYLVKYNEDVQVPEFVYYEIMKSLDAQRTRDDNIERLSSR